MQEVDSTCTLYFRGWQQPKYDFGYCQASLTGYDIIRSTVYSFLLMVNWSQLLFLKLRRFESYSSSLKISGDGFHSYYIMSLAVQR